MFSKSAAKLSRRGILGAAALASLGAAPASRVHAGPARAVKPVLTVYSPAPPTNPMHALNLHLAQAALGFPGLPQIEMIAVALPDSVNVIAEMPAKIRRAHLPIVTTADFLPARAGVGPAWHRYHRANRDLKFVTALYDVGFGIQTMRADITEPEHLKGKRIGVPPRPSAVRLLTEALLGDGWGVLEDVTLVDLLPTQVEAASRSGAIDATSWNLVTPSPAGFRPMLAGELGQDQVRYLEIDEATLEQINAANPFNLALVDLLADQPRLLSFAQALAAWDDTDPSHIRALLACLTARGADYAGLPDDIAAMVNWPALTVAEIHPAAQAFFAER